MHGIAAIRGPRVGFMAELITASVISNRFSGGMWRGNTYVYNTAVTRVKYKHTQYIYRQPLRK